MEIKSVVLRQEKEKDEASNGVKNNHHLITFHSLTNTEDDSVAKGLKSLDDKEIVFFKALLEKLMEDKYLSFEDIERQVNITKEINVPLFLPKLEQIGWLQRDDRNYWELGIFSPLIQILLQ